MTTIALVDDDSNILTSVSIALEAEGYRIVTYNDGISALDGFKQNGNRILRSWISRCRVWMARRRCAACAKSPICR